MLGDWLDVTVGCLCSVRRSSAPPAPRGPAVAATRTGRQRLGSVDHECRGCPPGCSDRTPADHKRCGSWYPGRPPRSGGCCLAWESARPPSNTDCSHGHWLWYRGLRTLLGLMVAADQGASARPSVIAHDCEPPAGHDDQNLRLSKARKPWVAFEQRSRAKPPPSAQLLIYSTRREHKSSTRGPVLESHRTPCGANCPISTPGFQRGCLVSSPRCGRRRFAVMSTRETQPRPLPFGDAARRPGEAGLRFLDFVRTANELGGACSVWRHERDPFENLTCGAWRTRAGPRSLRRPRL